METQALHCELATPVESMAKGARECRNVPGLHSKLGLQCARPRMYAAEPVSSMKKTGGRICLDPHQSSVKLDIPISEFQENSGMHTARLDKDVKQSNTVTD